MRKLSLLIAAGCLAACGDVASPSGNEAAITANDGAMIDRTADAEAPQNGGGAGPVAAKAEPERGAGVTSLPLKRGFYVADGTSCGEASNATLMLVRRDGISTSRVPCEFKHIEKVGPASYRVTEQCSEGGPAWGAEEHVSTDVVIYEILSETSFKSKSGSGWENGARHCVQSSLPAPWRDNDIRDVVE